MKRKILFLVVLTVFLIPFERAVAQSAEIVTTSIVDNTCYQAAAGEWLLDTANFVGDLHIVFSTGAEDTLSIYNLSEGTYWYWAVDLAFPLDTLKDTIMITEPSPVEMSVLYQESPHCYKGNDGKVIVNLSGGIGHYYGIYYLNDTGFTIHREGDTRFALDSLSSGWTVLQVKDYYYHCYRTDSLFVQPRFDGPLSGRTEVRDASCPTCTDGGIRLASAVNAYPEVMLYYQGYYENPFENWIDLAPGVYQVELKSMYVGGYCVTSLVDTVGYRKEVYEFTTPTGYIIGQNFDIFTTNGLSISKMPELANYELRIIRTIDNWGSQTVLQKKPSSDNVLPWSLDIEAGAYIWELLLSNGQKFAGVINVINHQ